MSNTTAHPLNPTAREVRQFALLVLLFFAALGGLAGWKHEVLLGVAPILTVAWALSLIFNSEQRVRQLLGVLIPAVMAAAGSLVALGASSVTSAAVVAGAGVVLSILIFASATIGRVIYRGWMFAAIPIGWTMSTIILGAVYYGMMTPIGLLMRVAGRDALSLKLDPSADSYWIKRPIRDDSRRYFRQF